MKKLNLIVAVGSLVFQVVSFINIFLSNTNEQIIFSIVVYIGFSILSALAILLNDKEKNNLNII